MKIAVTAAGTDLQAPVDRHFGRCPNFVICDLTSMAVEAIDNEQNLQLPQGAGIQSARTVAAADVKFVVTGHCGPKAFATLQAAGIGVVLGAEGTVGDAIDAFRSGRLKPAEAPDVEGHWV